MGIEESLEYKLSYCDYQEAIRILDHEEVDLSLLRNLKNIIYNLIYDNKIEILKKIFGHISFDIKKSGFVHRIQIYTCLGDFLRVKEVVENQNDKSWSRIDYLCPLYISSMMGYHKIVDLLLQSGEIEPDNCTEYYKTPFCIACTRNNVEVVKVFLKYDSIDFNKPFGSGTPFYWTCLSGSKKVFDVLIKDDRIDFHKKSEGETPLMIACDTRNEEIVDGLLNNMDYRKIDINDDHNGKTALGYACINREIFFKYNGENMGIIKSFLQIKNIDINKHIPYCNGNLFYHLYCLEEHDIIDLFLKDDRLEIKLPNRINTIILDKIVDMVLRNPHKKSIIKEIPQKIFDEYENFNILFNSENFIDAVKYLRIKTGIADEWATELWYLIKLIECEHYKIPFDCDINQKRFYDLIKKLPCKLQMNIINKVYSHKILFVKTQMKKTI